MFQLLYYLSLVLVITEAKSLKQSDAKKPFELNEFLQGTFTTKSFNGSWLSENTIYYKNSLGDILLFDTNTKKSSQFLNSSVLDDYKGSTITLSPDELFVLIRYNVSAVFRHSTTALYAIYDIKNEIFHDIAEQKPVQIAQWAPIRHDLVYVYLNNIYYLANPSLPAKAVTTNGVSGVVYNGVPDWVYEEEVLGTGSALWFSPNGKQIAFASFNDTNVSGFKYFTYGTPGALSDQYPKEITIKYPKVGTPNPVVTTYIANLETDKDSIEVSKIETIPTRFLPEDYVLYDITWITDDEILFLYTNRVQNEGELLRCTKDGSCKQEASYKVKNGWLDPRLPKYNKGGNQRIEILPQHEDFLDDYFDHIVLTDVDTGTVTRLTSGGFVVISVYGWDQRNNLVYFLATKSDPVNQPSQLHVYVLNIETKDTKCLTCEMETPEGVCKYASASFNKDFTRFVKICQGPGPHVVEIHNVQNESDVFIWEDNKALREKLALKQLPVIKNLRVPVDGGFVANVRLLLPPSLDENSSKKYPAVVNVYAGPDSNQITDAYSSGFQNYIVTNRGYIYIYIDGRGSGKDGRNKMFQVYRRLGTVEIQDQISVTRYLQETLQYIDANNTGIWGWSYGGFATAWALVQDVENVFKFGLSVAPVTSFIYYDSIYTERYMGLPTKEDNLAGYNNTDITRNVEGIRGKSFFLIHGNADDNVHYQQSMLLSKALELADIPFRQQSYPDENHSLRHVSPHLYHTIDRFWARSYNLPDPPAPRLKPEEKTSKKH